MLITVVNVVPGTVITVVEDVVTTYWLKPMERAPRINRETIIGEKNLESSFLSMAYRVSLYAI